MKLILAVIAGVSLAMVVALAPAGAQEAPPTPCNGMLYTDPAGDATYFDPTAPPDFSAPGNPNEDIRGLFFNYREGVLTANIVVANLDKTESGAIYATASKWEVSFGAPDGENYYAKAVTDGSAWTFELERIERIGTGLPVDPGEFVTEPAKGAAFEGPMGVLSIEIPPTVPDIKPGAKLEAVDVTSIPRESVQQPGFFTDTAPDSAPKDYVVVECPAAETPATDTTQTGTTPPPTTPQEPPSQQPPAQQPPAQAGPPAQTGPLAPGSPLPATGKLSADVAVDKGKRKTAAKRGLRARVRCSVQCKVRATATISKKVARKLKLGRKAMKIGTGKASITKAGRIPFFVKMTKKTKRALKRKGVKKFALKVAFRVTDNQGKQVKKVTRKSTLR